MNFLLACAAIALLTPSLPAQPPAFEVASIKPAPPPTGPGISVHTSSDQGRVTMSNVSLRDVLLQAYKIRGQQLSTPDWMDNTRFDIVAKIPADATKEQVPAMLQTLLADRFRLVLHKESKIMPVYALVPTKSGPKLHPVDGEHGLHTNGTKAGTTMKGEVSMATLAEALSRNLDRPVVDMTGIPGAFEIEMSWRPDDAPADASDSPSLFTALQETMGLKLEARKAPLDYLVVDHAEKLPTEN